jgi:hypothetical protein
MHCTIPVKAHPKRNRNEKEELKRKTKRRRELIWHSATTKMDTGISVGRNVPLD